MNKLYGRLTFVQSGTMEVNHRGEDVPTKAKWIIKADPHVMMRLKSFFPRADKYEFGKLTIIDSDEVCRDIEWFLMRFPMEMDYQTENRLVKGSRSHQDLQLEMEKIMALDFKPRKFPLAKPLRDYQARTVEIHSRNGSLLVADQLGLGKTVTAIGTLTRPETLPALVVCQTHLTRQWQRFFKEFLPKARVHAIKSGTPYETPPADVYITTYHKLAGWAEVMSRGMIKSIIFDEYQELRHCDTGKWRAAMAIRIACRFAMGLSATPIYNYGGEMFNVMEVLSPGKLGGRGEFYREWCYSRGNGKHVITDPKAFGSYLRDNFLMLRRTREEVGLELPPLQRVVQTIPYSDEALEHIKDVATELAHLILKGSFEESGQAAREFDIKLRQATGIAKAAYVAEYVRMLVDDGSPVLLFGWHRAVYDVWLERLKDYRPVLYTGTESPKQKDEALELFARGSAKVMIMSLRAGSGVDGIQVGCNTAVFGELDWSPGVHEQCIGRLNRDGLKGGVSAFFLVADGGSDPVVAEVLGLKTAQVKEMVDPQSRENVIEAQTDMGRVKKMAKEYLNRRYDTGRSSEYVVAATGQSLGVIQGGGKTKDAGQLSLDGVS